MRREAMTHILREIHGTETARWKMITLTLQHSSAPLKQQHNYIRKCFRRLRQRQLWRNNVVGGWAVIETTWNPDTGHWHPHLHVLAQTPYIPQKQLSSVWCQITKGSKIVDIRIVESEDGCVHYITDYIAKAPKLDHLSDPMVQLADYYHALDNAKLLITFGTHRELNDADTESTDPDDWIAIGTLADYLDQARSGDMLATQILLRLEGNTCHAPYTPVSPET